MYHSLFINYLFVISVILIWFMLGYQLLLFLLGFYYSRKSAQEKVRLARANPALPSISILIPAHNEALGHSKDAGRHPGVRLSRRSA